MAFNPHCLVAGMEMIVTAGRQHVRFWILHPAGGGVAELGGVGTWDEAGGDSSGRQAGYGGGYGGATGEVGPAVWDVAVKTLPGQKRRFGVSMWEAGSAKYQLKVSESNSACAACD